MYPYSDLPEPLSPLALYILLALSQSESHGYTLMASARNNSLGSVNVKSGLLYPLLKKMVDKGLIEKAGHHPTGRSGETRLYYRITNSGLTRLRGELKRLKRAVEIGEAQGHFNDELPADLRDLIESLK